MFKRKKQPEINEESLALCNGSFSAEYILSKALDIGELILRCGAEPNRIEDTVKRICISHGARHADIFALPSLITASIRMKDGTQATDVRRVYQTRNDMFMLDGINTLSRDICEGRVSLDMVDEKIRELNSRKPFPSWFSYIGSMLGAGGFALFFGGTILDGCAAALAGLVVAFINMHKAKFMNQMVHTVISSFFGAVAGLLLVKLGLGQNADLVMIGTIMLLIPGLAFGNAVRDLLFGDTISGIIQIVQAILLAVMVAFGFAVAIMLLGGVAV